MTLKIKERIKSIDKVYIIVTVLSVLFFVIIYGVHVINPLNVGWFYTHHNDIGQQYLGWKAFRHTPWKFPIGLFNTLSYPTDISIMFLDAVPGVATLFKFLSPILPNHFQYIGPWAVLCFVLQSVLTARILLRYTQNRTFVVLMSFMFTTFPVFLYRVFIHSSLTPHWLVLYALEPVFNHRYFYEHPKKLFVRYCLATFYGVCTNLYFSPLCAIILLGYLVSCAVYEKNYKLPLLMIAAYGLVTFATVALLGGFSPVFENMGVGAGKYGLNLNSFFNPSEYPRQSWSAFLYDMPFYDRGQLRGLYWGLGCFILVLISAFAFFEIPSLKEKLKANKFIITALGVSIVTALIVSTIPIITFGDKVLLNIKLPFAIEYVWASFRANARFSWVITYAIMLSAAIVLARVSRKNKKLACAVVLLCIVVQLADIRPYLAVKHEAFFPYEYVPSPLNESEFWLSVSDNENIEHFVFSTIESRTDNKIFFNIANWATDHDITLNDFYFSRYLDHELFANNLKDYLASPEGCVFLFSKEDAKELMPEGLTYYIQDGYIVGSIYEFEGFEKMSRNDVLDFISTRPDEVVF